MAMKKSSRGGGPGSRVVTNQSIRTGAARQQIHAGGVAQIGQRQSSHSMQSNDTGYRGERLVGPQKPISVPLGNAVALNVGKGGPGTGRTVYGRGMQSVHGTPAQGQATPKRDILSEFGPESKRS